MNINFTQTMRLQMLADDPRCFFCLRMLTEETASIDHLVPVSRGGETTPENCRLACMRCNERKADHHLHELVIIPRVGVMIPAQAEYLLFDERTRDTIGFSYAGREWLLDEIHAMREMLANLPDATWQIGRQLRLIRESLPEAGFRLWIKEWGWMPSHAERFIRIAERIPEPRIKRCRHTALRMLSRDDVPEAAINAVVALANAGELVSVRKTAATIREHLRASRETRGEIPRVSIAFTCETNHES